MLNRDDIEGFLDRLTPEGASYEEIEQGLWVVRPGGNLELEHLDFEEFLAAYESMTLALASHLRELASYREGR